jgi:hypothetical protein
LTSRFCCVYKGLQVFHAVDQGGGWNLTLRALRSQLRPIFVVTN